MESPKFRYIAAGGGEVPLATVRDLATAIKSGHVHAETMLFDSNRATWALARDSDAYQLALEFAPPQAPDLALTAREALPSVKKTAYAPTARLTAEPLHVVQRERAIFRYLAICLSSIWAVLMLYSQQNNLGDWAGAIGYTVGSGALIGLLVLGARRIFRRHRNAAHTVVMAVFAALAWQDVKGDQEIRNDFVNTVGILSSQAEGSGIVGEYDPNSMNGIVTEAVGRSTRAWAAYHGAVDQAGDSWLQPAALSTASGRANASTVAQAMRAAVKALGDSVRASTASAQEKVRALAQANVRYSGAVSGFDRGANKTIALVEDFLAAENAISDRFDLIIALVTAEQPQLSADKAGLLFDNDAAAARYNRLVNDLPSLLGAEEKAAQALQAREQNLVRMADSIKAAID